MTTVAFDRHAKAALRGNRRDDSEPYARALQDRSLLDVQLDICRDVRTAALRNVAQQTARVVCERIAETRPVFVGEPQRFVGGCQSREHCAAQTSKRKAASLFAGPRYRFDRMVGCDLACIE